MKDAKNRGIIVVPHDNRLEMYQMYNTDFIKHNGEMYVKLNGFFKPYLLVAFGGYGYDTVFKFKRKDSTFTFLGDDSSRTILMTADQIEKAVNYVSAELFSNMKNKYQEKESLIAAYYDFKKKLKEEFLQRYLYDRGVTNETFVPKKVDDRYKGVEHRKPPIAPKNFSKLEVYQSGRTWFYIGYYKHELFGYSMKLESLYSEPRMYNFVPSSAVKNNPKLIGRDLNNFAKYFVESVYHQMLMDEREISTELKEKLPKLQTDFLELFKRQYKAYSL